MSSSKPVVSTSQSVGETTDLLSSSSEYNSTTTDDGLDNNNLESGHLMRSSILLKNYKVLLFNCIIVAILYYTAYGLAVSPMIILQISKICKDYYLNIDGTCNTDAAVETNGRLTSSIAGFLALFSIFTSTKVGQLTDILGRRSVLNYSFGLFAIQAIIVTFLLNDFWKFHFKLYLAAQVLTGLLGNIKATGMIIRAMVLDMVPPKEQISSLSYISGCYFFGMAIGPMISSLVNTFTLNKDINSMYLVICFYLAALVFSCLLLPDTRPTKNLTLQILSKYDNDGSISDHRKLFSFDDLIQPFDALNLLWIKQKHAKSTQKRIKVLLLVLINLIINGGQNTINIVVVLYVNLNYGWGIHKINALMATTGISRSITCLLLTPIYMKWLHSRKYISGSPDAKHKFGRMELFNLRFGCFIRLLEVSIIIFFDNSIMVFVAFVVGAFSSIGVPTVQAGIVKLCHENITEDGDDDATKLGELMGGLALLENISIMIITSSVTWVFSATASSFPKACFVMLFLLTLVALISSWVIMHDEDEDEEEFLLGH